MPFEQSPSPVAPPPQTPGAWRAAAGVAAALMVLAVALIAGEWLVIGGAAIVLAAALVGGLILSRTRATSDGLEQGPAAARTGDHVATADSLFRGALECLPDPVLVVSGLEPDDYAGRRVLFANQAARDLLRLPPEGGLLVTGLRDPGVLEAIDEALFGGVVRTTGLGLGGVQDRVWQVWTSPLPAGADDSRRALVRLRDDTDAVRMERMRADFLANASHELRTPLASLAGFIETLKGHAREDPRAREKFLDIMAAQADRMSRLVADLLSLSRVELNEHIPPAGRADVALATGDVIAAMGPLAADRKVELRLTRASDASTAIAGERDEIVQVIQNLVDNAVKYAPPESAVEVEVAAGLAADEVLRPRMSGGARLSLLTPDRTEDARYVLVRVCDRGPGMDREHLPRLTERFYRVEGQKSGERRGTGLGLAIVKHIVNRHRGGLAVESAPGQGTILTAYFPLASAEPGRAA